MKLLINLKNMATTNEVLELLGNRISRTGLMAWVSKGAFPKPLRISPRKLLWNREEVEKFLASRLEA